MLLVELNLNNPKKSLEFFNMTNKFNGFGDQIPLNDDYYTYFKKFWVSIFRASGDIEGSNVLFNEIKSKNFYGIQPSLVEKN